MIRELAAVLWFAVVAVAFFAPYLGITLSVAPLTAIYALFLMVGIVLLVLRTIGRREERTQDRG